MLFMGGAFTWVEGWRQGAGTVHHHFTMPGLDPGILFGGREKDARIKSGHGEL